MNTLKNYFVKINKLTMLSAFFIVLGLIFSIIWRRTNFTNDMFILLSRIALAIAVVVALITVILRNKYMLCPNCKKKLGKVFHKNMETCPFCSEKF